ncbi:MAG: hypothetical protein KGH54_03690 [Candidatus Micrarchaeota archaeon]|nr:hypothetical protein [Candidatus Micrarchaeota archaeon]
MMQKTGKTYKEIPILPTAGGLQVFYNFERSIGSYSFESPPPQMKLSFLVQTPLLFDNRCGKLVQEVEINYLSNYKVHKDTTKNVSILKYSLPDWEGTSLHFQIDNVEALKIIQGSSKAPLAALRTSLNMIKRGLPKEIVIDRGDNGIVPIASEIRSIIRGIARHEEQLKLRGV